MPTEVSINPSAIHPAAVKRGITAMAMRSDPITRRAYAGRPYCNDGVADGIADWAYHDDGRSVAEAPTVTPPTWAAALGGVSRHCD
jgi:hypothetical protein